MRWIEWGIAVLFLILTVVFLSGKGAFLIAGYNTASSKETQRYDRKKLCRVVGAGMAVVTATIFCTLAMGENMPAWMPDVFLAITLVTAVVLLILCNTVCRVREEVSERKESQERILQEEKSGETQKKWGIRGSVIFTAVICVFVGVLLVTGDIEISVTREQIDIAGSYWSDYTVEVGDILSVSYTEDLETGKRTGGFGSFKLAEGNFKNSEFGSYKLYAYTGCDSYVVMETADKMVVVNCDTKEKTKELYEKIKAAVY